MSKRKNHKVVKYYNRLKCLSTTKTTTVTQTTEVTTSEVFKCTSEYPKKISFLNCCPHEVVIIRPDGSKVIFPQTNIVTRLPVTENALRYTHDDIPVKFLEYDIENINLPEPCDGIMYIVSAVIFDKTNRIDVVKPDCGQFSVRDDNGRTLAVHRFIGKYPYYENCVYYV